MHTKEGRLRRALSGMPLERPPYTFWTHLPGVDLDPDALVRETVRFATALDVDFVKAMSNGLYCVEDWGGTADYSAVAQGGVARVVASPIAEEDDWQRIGRLPMTAPALARELRHLDGLVKALGADTPVLATVFSPLTIAHKLAGAALERDVRAAPDRLLAALDGIAETTAEFARTALALGCAGVFFAVQDANPDHFDDASYAVFGERFDRRVLEAASAGWFNVLHMHGAPILFERLKDYPVTALNWHIGETPPTVAAYRRAGGTKPIVGGLRREALTARNLDAVKDDLATLAAATAGRKAIISPGCVIRHPVDMEFLKTVAGLIARGA